MEDNTMKKDAFIDLDSSSVGTYAVISQRR